MVRLRAPDCSSPKSERKEWLTYRERWKDKNWSGGKYTITISPKKYLEETDFLSK